MEFINNVFTDLSSYVFVTANGKFQRKLKGALDYLYKTGGRSLIP